MNKSWLGNPFPLLPLTPYTNYPRRKIFAMLVVAEQPLHLSELLNALSTRDSATDYVEKRTPRPELVGNLCGALLTFDHVSKGSEDDPLLKLAHKSIQDFFLENPASLNVPDNLSQYFVNPDTANQEMGLVCLTYLNYARYQKPLGVSQILKNDREREHAFLSYAARFWFQHLIGISHSENLFSIVKRFVYSPAFWTCMTVQSVIAPHLFSQLIECKRGAFSLNSTTSRSFGEHKISYPVPLPDWLDLYGESGTVIIRRYLSFVKEWFPVLTTYPSAIDQCIGDIVGIQDFPLRHPSEEVHQVKVLNFVQSRTCTSDTANWHLGAVVSNQDTLDAWVYESPESGLTGDVNLKILRNLSSKSLDCIPCYKITASSVRSSNILHVIFGEDSKDPSIWLLDPDSLGLTLHYGSNMRTYESSSSLKSPEGEVEYSDTAPGWLVNANFVGSTEGGEAIAYHCIRRSKCDNKEGDSSSDDSNFDSESESDSTYHSGSESDSRLLDADPASTDCHCLVIVHQGGPPLWNQ